MSLSIGKRLPAEKKARLTQEAYTPNTGPKHGEMTTDSIIKVLKETRKQDISPAFIALVKKSPYYTGA